MVWKRLSVYRSLQLRTSTFPLITPQSKSRNWHENRINDNSVPYPTAAIETIDHFAQWQDQRLIVDYNDAGIIRSWSREQQDYPVDEKEKEREKGKGKEKARGRVKKSLKTYIGTLPPVLRYRFPFNYVSFPTPPAPSWQTLNLTIWINTSLSYSSSQSCCLSSSASCKLPPALSCPNTPFLSWRVGNPKILVWPANLSILRDRTFTIFSPFLPKRVTPTNKTHKLSVT